MSASTATSAAALVSLSWGSVTVSDNVCGRPLLLDIVELFLESDSLAFVQGLEAILDDLGVMDENVFTAISRGDEAEALITEEFDGSLERHGGNKKIVIKKKKDYKCKL